MQWTLSDTPVFSNSIVCTFMWAFNMLLINFSTQQNTYFMAQVMLCGDAYSNCLAPPSGEVSSLCRISRLVRSPWAPWLLLMIPGKHSQQSSALGLGVSVLRLLFSETPGLRSQLLSNFRELFPSECTLISDMEKTYVFFLGCCVMPLPTPFLPALRIPAYYRLPGP